MQQGRNIYLLDACTSELACCMEAQMHPCATMRGQAFSSPWYFRGASVTCVGSFCGTGEWMGAPGPMRWPRLVRAVWMS